MPMIVMDKGETDIRLKEDGKHIKLMIWNPFERRHGKSSRDTHFAAIRAFVKARAPRHSLQTPNDLKLCIDVGQRMRNICIDISKTDPTTHIFTEVHVFDTPKLSKDACSWSRASYFLLPNRNWSTIPLSSK